MTWIYKKEWASIDAPPIDMDTDLFIEWYGNRIPISAIRKWNADYVIEFELPPSHPLDGTVRGIAKWCSETELRGLFKNKTIEY